MSEKALRRRAGFSRVALNPLPWVLAPTGVQQLGGDRLVDVLREVHAAGFGAVMADLPDGVAIADYRAVLDVCGLHPAPGYFAAAFEQRETLARVIDDARRSAQQHAELGLTEMFVAGTMVNARTTRPAVGAAFDETALDAFTANLGRVAEAMSAEGVRPLIHPHVGSLVETEQEVRFVLDNTDPASLGFGPDTGHLFWAGMEPALVIADYADRVGGVHLKDVHRSVAEGAAADGATYAQATFERHLWTEPGQGDVDLLAVLKALPDFTGWWLVEVDVPDRTSPRNSAVLSAAWVTDHLGSATLRP